jgi:hypothetical protein
MTAEPIISPQAIIATQIATIAALRKLVTDLYAELSRCANGVYSLERIDTPEAMQAHLEEGLIILREANVNLDQWLNQPR